MRFNSHDPTPSPTPTIPPERRPASGAGRAVGDIRAHTPGHQRRHPPATTRGRGGTGPRGRSLWRASRAATRAFPVQRPGVPWRHAPPAPDPAPRTPLGMARRSRPPPRQRPRRRHVTRRAAPRPARRPRQRAANPFPKRRPSPPQETTKSRPRNQSHGPEFGRPRSLRGEFRFSRTQEIIHAFSHPISTGRPLRVRPERYKRGPLLTIQWTNNRHESRHSPLAFMRRSPGGNLRFSRLYQSSAASPPNRPALHPVTIAPATPRSPCVKP